MSSTKFQIDEPTRRVILNVAKASFAVTSVPLSHFTPLRSLTVKSVGVAVWDSAMR